MIVKRPRRDRNFRKEKTAGLLDSIFMQPWYVPRKIAIRITKMLPEPHTHKMRMYFEDYGCLRFGRRRVLYGSNGFCIRCKDKVMHQMLFTIRRHFRPSPLNDVELGTKEIRDARFLLKDFRPRSPDRLKLNRIIFDAKTSRPKK